jgi:hypothetical protein
LLVGSIVLPIAIALLYIVRKVRERVAQHYCSIQVPGTK